LCAKLSLAKNLPFFQSFIYASDLQIICLSETWLSEGITDHEILPQAYTIYRKDRGTRGGGVLLAISSNLPSRQIPSPENLEVVLYVSLFLLMILISPFVWCMHPQMLLPSITPTICTIAVSPNPVFIVGDFNLPDINWSTLSSISSVSSNFCELIFESNLTQVVESPTHSCGNIQDLVMTNSPEQVAHLTVHPLHYQCIASDHHLITFSISYNYSNPPTIIKEFFDFAIGNAVLIEL